jgi:uncharacterized membrane protein YfcA
MMLGAVIGTRLLERSRASAIRGLVVVLLVLAGVRALAKGVGWWS